MLHHTVVYETLFDNCNTCSYLLYNYSTVKHDYTCSLFFFSRSDIGEEVLVDCLKYIDSLLENASDHCLLEQLYSKNKALCKVIVLSANKRLSLGYVNRTLKLSVRFLQLG